MNTTFSEMIDRLTATTPEQEDYTGEDGLLLLAPGENRHSGPGENRQFWPDENRQSLFTI